MSTHIVCQLKESLPILTGARGLHCVRLRDSSANGCLYRDCLPLESQALGVVMVRSMVNEIENLLIGRREDAAKANKMLARCAANWTMPWLGDEVATGARARWPHRELVKDPTKTEENW